MTNPYTPPNTSGQDGTSGPDGELDTLIRRPFHLVWVALFFGGCGSAQTALQTSVWEVDDICLGKYDIGRPPEDLLMCNSEDTWPVSVLVCFLVPVLTHALLLSRFGGRRMGRLGIGALSVVLSVVVTFGCWRLMADRPLLIVEIVQGFIGVLFMGGILSPCGILLSGLLEVIVVRSRGMDVSEVVGEQPGGTPSDPHSPRPLKSFPSEIVAMAAIGVLVVIAIGFLVWRFG